MPIRKDHVLYNVEKLETVAGLLKLDEESPSYEPHDLRDLLSTARAELGHVKPGSLPDRVRAEFEGILALLDAMHDQGVPTDETDLESLRAGIRHVHESTQRIFDEFYP